MGCDDYAGRAFAEAGIAGETPAEARAGSGNPGERQFVNLWLGQLALTMAFGSLVAIHFARSKPWLAGLGLALISIKPNYALPIFLLLLVRRDFRAVAFGVLLGGTGTVAMTLALMNNFGGVGFLEDLVAKYGSLKAHPGIAHVELASGRIDAISILLRAAGPASPGFAKLLIGGGALALGGAAVYGLSHRRDEHSARGVSAALICLTTLACVYHNSYDALLLFLPVVASIAARASAWHDLGRLRWPIAAMLCFPLVNYFGTLQFTSRLGIGGAGLSLVMGLNAIAILLALALSAIASARRIENAPDREQTDRRQTAM